MIPTRQMMMEQLRTEGLNCTRCDLYQTATQVVWGEGNIQAQVMVIGQGPGEKEDEAGRPFIGPSGDMLSMALTDAGIDRDRLWITNTIKHWATKVQRGRRVNRPPRVSEVAACRFWLESELAIIKPQILICLGAPAAQAVIDKSFRISHERGQWRTGPHGEQAIATFHPSFLIRTRAVDWAAFEKNYAEVVDDFRAVIERAASLGIDIKAPEQV